MPTRNQLALQRILGTNPTARCSPTRQIPGKLLSQARGERAQQTADRYGNVLDGIQNVLHDITNLPTNQINDAIRHIADWLGKDDPVGLFHSLENGQLLNLLGEIAPVVAQWLSENLGYAGPGGRQSRRGGRARLTRQFNPAGAIQSLIELAGGISNAVGNLPSITIGGYPGASPQPGGGGIGPSGNPVGPPNTIDLGPDSNPPNVLEIPGN